MSLRREILVFSLLALLLVPFVAFGAWYETQNYGLGEIAFNPNTSPWGRYLEVPESNYIIFAFSSGFTYWTSLMTIDTNTGKLRDGVLIYHRITDVVSVPDPRGGWNIYFTDEGRFGRVSIDPHGEFGEEEYLGKTFESSTTAIAVPQRYEIWYFGKRIFRYDTVGDEWTEFQYPEGWLSDFSYTTVYPADDLNTAICRAKSDSLVDYQACWFDLETGESKLINHEPDFFQDIKDIEAWNAMPGQYLIMKEGELWSYSSITGEIELVMRGFKGYCQNILQEKSGRYLYTLGDGNGLYILDLVEKTYTTHLLSLNEGDTIAFSSQTDTMFDSELNKIIVFITEAEIFGRLTLGTIDLNELRLEYIANLPESVKLMAMYIPRQHKLFTSSIPYVYIVDIETGEVKQTTSLMNLSTRWSVAEGDPAPTLLPESRSTYFRRLGFLGAKELHSAGPGKSLSATYMFPESNTALLKVSTDEGKIFREYNFDDNTYQDIELPGDIHWYFPDNRNEQIVAFKRYDDAILQFIKPRGRVATWAPEDLSELSASTCYFDYQNDAFWAVYRNDGASRWHFYKVSTVTHELLDSFIVPYDEMNYPASLKADPSGRYLCFFQAEGTGKDLSDRYLVIFDIASRAEAKRFKLQEAVNNNVFGVSKVFPAMIFIPDHNRLLVWGHDRAWCIDLETKEMLYGELQVDPSAVCKYGVGIEGFYDESRQVAVIADFYHEGGRYDYDGVNILEVDHNTGEILKQEHFDIDYVRKIFISGDKKRIYMLGYEHPKYYVFHIDPSWENPPAVKTRSNFMEYSPGDPCRFTISIKNDNAQNANLYVWLCIPGGDYLFFNGLGFSPEITGIPLTLPAGLDVSADIVNFVIPEIMPEGFYNLNAILLSDDYGFGPMGTWNFYVGD